MSDRVQVIFTVPVDLALPGDVQGVAWRRFAIQKMSSIAVIDENSVRYKGFSETSTIYRAGGGYLSLWQHNLRAFQFIADGEAIKGVFEQEENDPLTQVWYRASVVQDYHGGEGALRAA